MANTTNYNFYKPLKGDTDWAGKNNENFDMIDNALSNITYNYKDLKADGINDDSVALQNLINQAQANKVKKLVIPNSNYRLNNMLFVTNGDLEIDFSGSTVLNYAIATNNYWGEVGIINMQGSLVGGDIVAYLRSLTGTHNPPAEAPILQTVEKVLDWSAETHNIGARVTTSNNNYFNIGDDMLIMGWTRPTAPPYESTKYEPELRIVAKVTGKDATYLYIDYLPAFDYPVFINNSVYKSRAMKVNLIRNIKIKNLVIDDKVNIGTINNPTTDERNKFLCGVSPILCSNLNFENIRVKNHKFPAFFPILSRFIDFKKLKGENAQMWNGGQGYVVQFSGCNYINCDNIIGDSCRHVIDFSWSSYGNVKNSYGVNSKSNDFSIHGLCEHDLTYENCNGTMSINHGIASFPNMSKNINIRNSNLKIFSANGTFDSFVDNLVIRDSTLEFTIQPQALNFIMENCKIKWHFAKMVDTTNKRGQNMSANFTMNNCKVYLQNFDNDPTRNMMGLYKWDAIVFRKTEFIFDFDPLLFSQCPTLYLSDMKAFTIESCVFNQLRVAYRNSVQPTLVGEFYNNTCDFTTQSGTWILYAGTLSSCDVIMKVERNTIRYNGASSYLSILCPDDSGKTNVTFTSSLQGNLLIGKSSSATIYYKNLTTGNASAIIASMYDRGNIIKNKNINSIFDTTNNMIS